MRWHALGYRVVLLLAVLALGGLPIDQVDGQQNQQGGGSSSVAGVLINGKGVLQKRIFRDPGGQLTRQRVAAAKQSMPRDLVRRSPNRKISLVRLEAALRNKGGVPTDIMRYLAGLERVRHVFYYPETRDIVIAGPAEGWITNVAGRVVGISSGRPVVQLQDLVVALRAFPPEGQGAREIGCSIDPTEEGLARLQHQLRMMGSTFSRGQERFVAARAAAELPVALGMQEVTVRGIPANTHFAQVMVEADYRMKLIGIGLEQPPVRMVSFVDRVSPKAVSRNALFRWYFVPDYQCVRQSGDGLAMELVGDGVKLIGEDELVAAGGQRRAASRGSSASQLFATSFSKRYPELAARSPVYAELRNLIDLVVAAAYLQENDYYGKAGWSMKLFGDEEAFSVQTYSEPKQVMSTLAVVQKGNQLMTPIGGGVEIHPTRALSLENLLPDEGDQVAKLREETEIELAEGQWWWD